MAENTLYKIALTKTMALCSRREYCCEDIRARLQSWSVSGKDAEKIISALIKENFLNEARYSEAFVKDKFRYNKWGRIKIAAYLKAKSIPGELIRSALDSVDDKLYRNTLKELIASHSKSVKAKNQYDLKGKLFRYGLSKGFESSLLYDLLNEM